MFRRLARVSILPSGSIRAIAASISERNHQRSTLLVHSRLRGWGWFFIWQCPAQRRRVTPDLIGTFSGTSITTSGEVIQHASTHAAILEEKLWLPRMTNGMWECRTVCVHRLLRRSTIRRSEERRVGEE